MDDTRRQLRDDLLAACQSEHDDQVSQLRDLDGKAQALLGIVGLFLAAAFAFVDQLGERLPPTGSVLVLTTVALAGLLLAVVFALATLWLRAVPAAPLVSGTVEPALRLLEIADGEELQQRYGLLIHDQSRLWLRAIAELRQANRRKGKLVRGAQVTLALAVAAVALLTFLSLASRVAS